MDRRFWARCFDKLVAPMSDAGALRKAIKLLAMHRLITRAA